MSADTHATAVALVELASTRGLRLAVAESLTGGLLAATIVSVPGASRVLTGAIIAYDTALKHTLLGVDVELLKQRGPVDDEVARQMARGARERCGVSLELASQIDATEPHDRRVEIAVATTGVAGPDPDAQSGQAVGTVWLGLSSPRGERAVPLQLSGDRAAIRNGTVTAALAELMAEIERW